MSPKSLINLSTQPRELDSSAFNGIDIGHLVSIHGEAEAKHRVILVQWLNSLLPSLNLPINITDDDLRACLRNGTVLCQILNRLRPGSVNVFSDSENSPLSSSENVKRFLAAMDGLGLPQFKMSDLEEGSMMAVVNCLLTLRAKSFQNALGEYISVTNSKSESTNGNASSNVHHSPSSEDGHSRKGSSESKFQRVLRSLVMAEPSSGLMHHVGHKFHEVFQVKHGSYADLSAARINEMMKSNSLENAPTQSLLIVVNGILDESVERKNGDIPHRVACLLRKVVQEIERRITTQAEHLRTQNNLFKAREEKYQSRIRVLEALASETREESEVIASQLQQLKNEKTKVEEQEKADQEDVIRLMKEHDQKTMDISTLKQELETLTKTHELRSSQLEAEVKGAKEELEQKSQEYEHLTENLRNKVKELEAFCESKYQKWNMKENQLHTAMDRQVSLLQELKLSWESIKQDIMEEQRIYSEECDRLGVNLKSLVDAARNYDAVLSENRILFNEVQELKGNIRVFCRIRPFLPGPKEKRSIVEHIGDNDLTVANPSKQGRDALRTFKFNKVLGPATTQVEVYSDIQPFIRSVLDGYNVCIFAYGQTGSGKTYTMSGPNGATSENCGVNYRALNDLFSISNSRASSLVYKIGVQMVEIYNEQVRDLLLTGGSQKRLGISTHTQSKGLAVPDASMFPVKSPSDVMELMDIGLKNRAMSSTAMNERSSRSHSVVSIHVRGTDPKSDSTLVGNLHLVDLAGSERVDRSEVTGDRLKEAQHINKSLSALGDVIFALAQKSSHVPYRNSKLTQLLQSSLGGQAKTLMFVQLNPDVNSFSESLSTLKFAERVSGVELGAAQSNKEGRDVRELMEQVASLTDTISKRDEEIERLKLLKDIKTVSPGANSEKRGTASLRYAASSPRRDSVGGTLKRNLKPSGGSNTRLEADSQQPIDDLDHQSRFLQQSKVLLGNTETDGSENPILTEGKKSSIGMEKAKAVSKIVRVLQKRNQTPSTTVTVSKDSLKMSPGIKRIPSSGQLKAPRRKL